MFHFPTIDLHAPQHRPTSPRGPRRLLIAVLLLIAFAAWTLCLLR